MARANLQRTAAQQARAEYQPQVRSVRRGVRSQVRSVRSSAPALEASLEHSADQLRHAGLSPQDLAIALSGIAHRTADVGASTALQTQQIQQEGHGQIVDLQAAEGQAQRSALTALQTAAAEHAQSVADEINAEQRGISNDILKSEAEKQLGLGDYGVSPKEQAEIQALHHNGGMTPTQQRAAAGAHHDAAFYAKQYFQGARDGAAGKLGAKVQKELAEGGFTGDPQGWTDQQWNHFVEKVAPKAGGDTQVAARAVQAIRDHVQPDQGSLLKALGTVASVAAPALAPQPLQPVAQFAGSLLHRH